MVSQLKCIIKSWKAEDEHSINFLTSFLICHFCYRWQTFDAFSELDSHLILNFLWNQVWCYWQVTIKFSVSTCTKTPSEEPSFTFNCFSSSLFSVSDKITFTFGGNIAGNQLQPLCPYSFTYKLIIHSYNLSEW